MLKTGLWLEDGFVPILNSRLYCCINCTSVHSLLFFFLSPILEHGASQSYDLKMGTFEARDIYRDRICSLNPKAVNISNMKGFSKTKADFGFVTGVLNQGGTSDLQPEI